MSDNLNFSITLPSQTVRINDKVILNLALENVGTTALYVNARFAVVPQIGDVWLNVKHNGDEVPFRFRVRLAELKNSDFLLLEPGERVIAGYHLTKGYKLDHGGTYSVMAEYDSQNIPAELKNYQVFQGHLFSSVEKLIVSPA